MRLSTRNRVLIFSALFFTTTLQAQNTTADIEKAFDLIRKNVATLMLTSDDISNSVISSTYTTPDSITMVYLQQAYKGIPVYNQLQVAAFKEGKLVSLTGSRIPKMATKVNEQKGTTVITPLQAVQRTAQYLQLLPPPGLTRKAALNSTETLLRFAPSGISKQDITVQALWVPVDENHLKLSWQTFVSPLQSDSMWLVRVDALTGEVLNKTNLTISCNWDHSEAADNFCHEPQHAHQGNSNDEEFGTTAASAINSVNYRVIPFPAESPIHPGGADAIRTNPWTAATGNAVSLGWQNDGTTEWTITRGNNVHAHLDLSATSTNNGPADTSSTDLPDLNFVQAPDYALQPTVRNNQRFATTNLFYWNNIMHDISYLYGFNEAAGNFQATNTISGTNRGGLGNDYVQADAQDGGGLNNANFGTPVDGNSPRMQMFLWSRNAMKVNLPAAIANDYQTIESNFSVNNKLVDKGPITNDVVYYNDDATGNIHLACGTGGTPANNIAGKIALIVRGNCDFVTKVKNAQNAGAIAAIVVNNVAGTISMGGSDNTITIPAVSITQSDGNLLMAQLNAGKVVNVTIVGGNLDGDLDNGIIAHEYTHGISTRLTGGPANSSCLQNAEQMGEGWSDYFGLMVTTDWATAATTDGPKPRSIGTYAFNQTTSGAGIRNYPYSTNMSINPWTYAMMPNTNGEVHNIGEIWCAMLWDMTWNIIQMDGINRNLYRPLGTGGNSVAMRLVMEGMKLQPCSPGFVDGRNAILRADTLYFNGRYSCAIWAAFARRGLGVNASQGFSNNYLDGVAGYTSAAGVVSYACAANKAEAVGYDAISYTATPTAGGCDDVSGHYITDTLPTNVTWISGGTYNAANRVVRFSPVDIASTTASDYTVKASVNANAYYSPTFYINETVVPDAVSANWASTGTGGVGWSTSADRFKSASYSFFAATPDVVSEKILVTTNSYTLSNTATSATTLSFWHYYDMETSYDGGVVELSTNNGNTWIDLGRYIIANGYTGSITRVSTTADNSPLAGRGAFTGNSGTFIQTIIDLRAFAGQTVKFRFRMGSDNGTAATGWYIDDILLKSEAAVINKSNLYDANNVLQYSRTIFIPVSPIVLPVAWGNFSVQKQGNASLLLWSTLQETNTSSFVIERSSDGVNFSPIATVAAAGNSTTRRDYTANDALPLKGINYYRILQKDKDGKATSTEVRTLSFDGLPNLITVSPNPAKNKIAITLPGNTEKLTAQIVSTSGQAVYSFAVNGQYSQQQLPALAAGVYYLKLTSNTQTMVKKLVIE